MKRSWFPDSLVLILGIVFLAQILTYVLPAGEFQRDGRSVLPGTYSLLEEGGASFSVRSLAAALFAIPAGMGKAADIIFLVFIVGGVIGIIKATGAIDAIVGAAIRRLGSKPILLVGGMTIIFGVGASTIGMAEEYLPFVPILVTMCLALKMDAVVALGMVYVGAAVGYGAAAANPFTVVIAQNLAGVEPLSGQGLRWGFFAVCIVIGIHHILGYVKRIQAEPSRGLVADVDYSSGFEAPKDVPMDWGRVAVLLGFAVTIGIFVWGSKRYEWYITELSVLFLLLGLFSAAVGRVSPNRAALEFKSGAAEMTTTALLIGFAKAISVVLDEGKVTDTIIHSIATPLQELSPSVAAVGMLGVQSLCNLFIPSGSGQAYVTMPIMAPLADLVGVTRQTAVLAYQMGDGFTNMIIPTNYVLMGMLGLGRIPYPAWVRFIGPLVLKLALAGILLLVLAVHFEF